MTSEPEPFADPLFAVTSAAPPSPTPVKPALKPVKQEKKPTMDEPLFDEAPPPAETPPTKPKPISTSDASPKVAKRPPPNTGGGLFEDEDSGDDLFSAVSTGTAAKKPETPPAAEPPGRKRPPGGVKLFGGVDLFGSGEAESKSSKEEKPAPLRVEKKKDDLFGKHQMQCKPYSFTPCTERISGGPPQFLYQYLSELGFCTISGGLGQIEELCCVVT